ncbi:hypothetical protein GCM10010172_08080 [Paractinoplanes ferrugineus]|uniref:Uncharacterized protein n=2 Tax=Paractinoplanes ferrugineus TaxID=113564 RepID=A0A919J5R1_9ACTN|nr:hypothetical protein [Actinoplanes ferrugineus]GIE15341.1 hypothetical protein Afe05nite_71810 [Actinoplanes ferrugineus]
MTQTPVRPSPRRPGFRPPADSPATAVLATTRVEAKVAVDSECESDYSPCVPIAGDVACADGSGNGPVDVAVPVTEVAVVNVWNDEPENPSMTDVRLFLDDYPETFEHGKLPSLVWNDEQGWRNDRPSRFVSALRNALRRV